MRCVRAYFSSLDFQNMVFLFRAAHHKPFKTFRLLLMAKLSVQIMFLELKYCLKKWRKSTTLKMEVEIFCEYWVLLFWKMNSA